jgi:hypothetical protein
VGAASLHQGFSPVSLLSSVFRTVAWCTSVLEILSHCKNMFSRALLGLKWFGNLYILSVALEKTLFFFAKCLLQHGDHVEIGESCLPST